MDADELELVVASIEALTGGDMSGEDLPPLDLCALVADLFDH